MFFPCAAITAHTLIYHFFLFLFLVFVSLDRRTIVTALPAFPSASSPPLPPYRSLECYAGVDVALFFMVVWSVWHPQKTE